MHQPDEYFHEPQVEKANSNDVHGHEKDADSAYDWRQDAVNDMTGQNPGDYGPNDSSAEEHLVPVTIIDVSVNDPNRKVPQEPLSSPTELAFQSLLAFADFDTNHDKMLSREELELAAQNPKVTGQDAQVVAGLLDPMAFNRISRFSNDERGKETGISSDDLWKLAPKWRTVHPEGNSRGYRDQQAIEAAYAAALNRHFEMNQK